MTGTNGHSPSPEEIARRGAMPYVPPPTPPSTLTPMEEGLLAVATDQPQTQAAMARKAGYKARSVTAAFTSLVRKRLLIRTPDGYCLPGPVPATTDPLVPFMRAIGLLIRATKGTATIIIRTSGGKPVGYELVAGAKAEGTAVLPPMEQAIVDVATDEPKTPETLARLAGYKSESVRKSITSLVRKRLLLRTADGYSLP